MSAKGPGAVARVAKKSPEARIRAATEGWFITEPLLFAALLTHRVVPTAGTETLRTGAGRIEYNPAFIEALPPRVLEEVLRLEAVRIVLKHPYTRRPPSGEVAYLASNITLKEHVPTSLPLPSAREVFGDASFSRQYYEFYCDRLMDRKGGSGSALSPSPSLSGRAAPEGEGAREREREGAEEIGSPGAPAAEHLAAASGPENAQLWQEDCLLREQIDAVIHEAEQSSTWGSLPGALVAHILATLRPRLDYRRVLRGFRTSILSSRRELTRMKPSRRYGFEYMGSRHRLRTRLLVAVDVSGSIGDADLEKAFSVVNQLFRYGIETIDVVQFDTELTGPVTTFTRRRPRVAITGRGGTSFAPVLAYIDEHPDYDGLIVITDGMAPRPEPPRNRRTRVLWLFHHEETYRRMRDNVSHVGEAVFIKPDPGPESHARNGSRRA